MATTVGRPGERGYKVIPKRTSLRDRQKISSINKKREEEGKETLKGTESLNVPLQSQKEAQAETEKVRTAQATVRQLNESAKRSGAGVQYDLVERNGELTVVQKSVERRAVSTGAGVGGVQQIPGLQTQITREEKKEVYTPVASSRSGGVLTREESSGRVFGEVGTSRDGGVIIAEASPQPQYVSATPVFSDRPGAGFATPSLFLSSKRREDVVRAGEFLEKGGKKLFEVSEKAPPGANVAALTTSFGARTLGGGLQRLGRDPQLTVAQEVVLPSTLGAGAGALTRVVGSRTPVLLESVGVGTRASAVVARGVTTGLGVAGTTALATTVFTRSPEEQSPDVLFAGLGARAGARPTVGLDVATKNNVVYGGAPTSNRAGRLNLRTAGKPQTKAETRKQSFNQNYNPQFVEKPGYLKVKSPTTGETRIYVQQAGKQKNIVFTRDVITKTTSVAPGVQRVQGLETKRNIGFQTPKTTYEQVSFPTQQGRVTQTRVAYGKEVFNYENLKGLPSKDVSSGSSASKQVFNQRVVNVANLPVPKTVRSVGKETPVFNNPQETINAIPSYELKPNAKVFTAPQSVVESRIAGSQPGRGRVYENIVARARAKNAARTDFVLVNTPVTQLPSVQSAGVGVRDVALSGRFNNVPSLVSGRAVSDVSIGGESFSGVRVNPVIDVRASTVSRPIQQIKPFAATLQEQETTTRTTTAPKLSVVAAERTAASPIVFQGSRVDSFAIISPAVKQTPIAAQRSVVEQRSEQRSRLVAATGFDFGGATPPTLKFVFEQPKIVPPPSIVRGGPRPPKPVTTQAPGNDLPTAPPRFALPNSQRGGAQYEVQVGSKGNKYFFDLGRGGKDVLTKARDLAKGTAAASIRVRPLSRGAGDNVSSLLGSDFVRNKAGVYVQKTETRISSSGEKAQIPGASKNKRLTKGSSYGDALKKVNKGASLRGLRRGFF